MPVCKVTQAFIELLPTLGFEEAYKTYKAARTANTYQASPFPEGKRWGDVKNRALHDRLHAAWRAELIRRLGWEPEASDSYQDQYAATTGEMVSWFRTESP